MYKILFIVCSHGDELAGYDLFLKHPYGKTSDVEWKVVVGNPEAVFLNTRFVESDLNRSCNVKTPKTYEEKRAVLLKNIMKDYDVVYDIHTTTAIHSKKTWEKVIFVNNIDEKTLSYLDTVDIKTIIWDSDKEYQKQYVTGMHPFGITLEYEKLLTVEETRSMIMKDVMSIIANKKLKKKTKLLLKADKPVTQKQREEFNLQLTDLVKLTVIQKKQLQLPVENTYYPIFINPPEIDAVNYCFLNREITT